MFHHSVVLGTSDVVDNRLRKSDCGISHFGCFGVVDISFGLAGANIQLRTSSEESVRYIDR